jgi:hypothetical protein
MLPGRFSPLGTLVLSGAGFWWEVETPIYRARLPIPTTQFGSLDGSLAYVDWKARNNFKLKTPKIPARLLGQAAAYFARELRYHGGQVEALAWLTWSGEKWDLVVPPQEQSAFRVTSAPVTPGDQVAMILHSHGSLPAFFSAVDDASEQDGFLYGVIGGLAGEDRSRLSLKFRAGHAGYFLPLEVADVVSI